VKKAFILSALAALFVIAPASAATITWNFSNFGTGDLGSVTKSFNATSPAGLPAIVATGNHHLYYKNDGGDETGLGLVGDSDHEIEPGDYIILNLSALSGYTNFKLKIGSVQSGESYRIYGSTTGALGSFTSLFTGTLNNTFFAVPSALSTYSYLKVTAPEGDVLLMSASADTGRGEERVPEPATFALVGSALVGLYFVRRRAA
jgi:hypothetical protein